MASQIWLENTVNRVDGQTFACIFSFISNISQIGKPETWIHMTSYNNYSLEYAFGLSLSYLVISESYDLHLLEYRSISDKALLLFHKSTYRR